MKRIYVVDPDRNFIDFLKVAMEGYCVEGNQSGFLARQDVEQNPPDIIITELWLPDISGLEFVEMVMASPKTSRVPVIVCSAASLEVHKHRAYLARLGVRIIEKPFDLYAFANLIDSLADEKGNADASSA